jgi:hypothetical protein
VRVADPRVDAQPDLEPLDVLVERLELRDRVEDDLVGVLLHLPDVFGRKPDAVGVGLLAELLMAQPGLVQPAAGGAVHVLAHERENRPGGEALERQHRLRPREVAHALDDLEIPHQLAFVDQVIGGCGGAHGVLGWERRPPPTSPPPPAQLLFARGSSRARRAPARPPHPWARRAPARPSKCLQLQFIRHSSPGSELGNTRDGRILELPRADLHHRCTGGTRLSGSCWLMGRRSEENFVTDTRIRSLVFGNYVPCGIGYGLFQRVSWCNERRLMGWGRAGARRTRAGLVPAATRAGLVPGEPEPGWCLRQPEPGWCLRQPEPGWCPASPDWERSPPLTSRYS